MTTKIINFGVATGDGRCASIATASASNERGQHKRNNGAQVSRQSKSSRYTHMQDNYSSDRTS